MALNYNYPKGSEWRKWDLHVHTPFSYLDNQFGSDFDNYVNELFKKALEKNIIAIGITDYFTIEGYKKLKNEYLKSDEKLKELGFVDNEIKEIKRILFLPNIEFRLNKLVGDSRINFHVIFSDKVEINHIEENFLREIKFVYEGNPQNEDEKRPLSIQNLEDLGKRLKKEHPEFKNKADIVVGMMNAVVDDTDILKVLSNKKSIFEGKYLTFVPADEDLSKISWDSQDHNVRKIIIQKSDGFFSSNQSTREFGLGRKHSSIEKFLEEFKTLKPCIWGSDAKRYEKLFEPDSKRYTWIKSDPTFEGLKQIIYEPEERVYIGEEPPLKIERDKIIKSLTVSNSNRWLKDNKSIPLNEGLVSIIGGKGTGKTAILDLIAYATGSYRCYEEDVSKSKSFLKRAYKELNNLTIKVEWDDKSLDAITITDKLEEGNKEGKVRYLPQDFVDQLCSEIGKDELEKQIENVIFQKIPPENKASFIDFKSYKDAQLKVLYDKKEQIVSKIMSINEEIYKNKQLIISKSDKSKEIEKVENELKKYEKEITKILEAIKKDEEQSNILNTIRKLTNEKDILEKNISQLNEKLLKIEEIINDISKFKDISKQLTEQLRNKLKIIGISDEIINSIYIVLYPEDLEQRLDERKKSIESEVAKKQKELNGVIININAENEKLTLEKSKQDKIKDINDKISNLKIKKDSLNKDIEKIENAEKKLPQLVNSRQNLFINFFDLIFEEKRRLKESYAPLEKILNESREENEKLFDFTIKFGFDVKSMSEEVHKLIDLRADGLFRQSQPEKLKEELERIRFNLNIDNEQLSEEDKQSIAGFLSNVEKFFTQDGKTISSQLKEKKYTEQDFYNWLYSTKYYSISYSIKFNEVELNNLSPGLKGVALLILFLELDRDDKRPILIDQPEENLDNRSVYITLMKYFREAKKRRQIIIVTHNPNLVVNTDSEQVIVANFDKALEKQSSRISYVSGSLENTFKDNSASTILEKQGIKEHVCEILEGGKEAFEKRERKYGFR